MSSIIQIKRSITTNTPNANTLAFGELAYSYSSNSLFIGDNANGSLLLFSNLSFTGSQANAAYNQANAAYAQANAAYAAANGKLSLTGGTVSGNLNVSQDLVVSGNLTILGNHTTINTISLLVDENVIYLSANTVAAPVNNNYLTVVRGTSPNTYLVWDESVGKWGWSDDGVTNVYFSDTWTLANTANTTAAAAYSQANAARSQANTAYGQANTAYAQANAAYAQANTANNTAAGAYAQANAAYAQANSKFSSSGGTINGDVLITGNLTANGVVTMTIDGGTF